MHVVFIRCENRWWSFDAWSWAEDIEGEFANIGSRSCAYVIRHQDDISRFGIEATLNSSWQNQINSSRISVERVIHIRIDTIVFNVGGWISGVLINTFFSVEELNDIWLSVNFS